MHSSTGLATFLARPGRGRKPRDDTCVLYRRAVIDEALIDAVDPAAISPEHANAFSRPTVVRVAFNRREYHALHALDKSDVAVPASR